LSYNLIGKLSISQEGIKPQVIAQSIVATSKPTDVVFDLYDPSKFFKDFNITYDWTVGAQKFNDGKSTLVYNFTSPIEYTVTLVVSAYSEKLNFTRYGQISQAVTAKDVITDLRVDGKTWITRDRQLDLNVTCVGGTQPYYFCKNIFFDNATASKPFACPEPRMAAQKCLFHVSWYFGRSDTYYLVMQAINDVSNVTVKFEINVVEINKQAQLSFVVIPVASTILAIIIVMVGIAYHLQQRQRYIVEVADFNFQQQECLIEKTFFERVREAFSNSFKNEAATDFMPISQSMPYDGFINDVDVDRQEIGETNHVTESHTPSSIAV
jgi:hypothetical protein